MPHQIRIRRLLPRPSGRRRSVNVVEPERVRAALMTRAQWPAIAPVVRSPQRPTPPDGLAQGSSAPLWKVVALSAARGCDDQARTPSARGGAPTPTTTGVMPAPPGAICPKRSPSRLLISSPGTRRGDLRGEARSPRTGSAVARAPHSLVLAARAHRDPQPRRQRRAHGRLRRPDRSTRRHLRGLADDHPDLIRSP